MLESRLNFQGEHAEFKVVRRTIPITALSDEEYVAKEEDWQTHIKEALLCGRGQDIKELKDFTLIEDRRSAIPLNIEGNFDEVRGRGRSIMPNRGNP